MKKRILLLATSTILFAACNKKNDSSSTVTVNQKEVITSFVTTIAVPQYENLKNKAVDLQTAVSALNANPTAANLDAARSAWKNVRSAWELCEGFLIGPVSDDNYDPNMDTWPVDHLQLDSFVNNATSFSATTIGGLNQSLRGFHPLEFILWGKNGNATIDSISDKRKQYLQGLADDVVASASGLYNSWIASGSNFQSQMLLAGEGSTRFTTKKDAMLAIAAGIKDICGEVGGGKIKEPFEAYDSTLAESPFAHNSITDFINNIKGAQNVYMCSYNGKSGASLSQFVAARNIALDNKIKEQFNTAINALNTVNVTFESAIFTQRTQLQNVMTALSTLETTLENELNPFILTYVTD